MPPLLPAPARAAAVEAAAAAPESAEAAATTAASASAPAVAARAAAHRRVDRGPQDHVAHDLADTAAAAVIAPPAGPAPAEHHGEDDDHDNPERDSGEHRCGIADSLGLSRAFGFLDRPGLGRIHVELLDDRVDAGDDP